jgi:glycine hydroxymethyltransferase
MLDWRDFGAAYAAEMIAMAQALAEALAAEGLPVFAGRQGFTRSHQFALEAATLRRRAGGVETAAPGGLSRLGIGLPLPRGRAT